jgi:hypothetical protein
VRIANAFTPLIASGQRSVSAEKPIRCSRTHAPVALAMPHCTTLRRVNLAQLLSLDPAVASVVIIAVECSGIAGRRSLERPVPRFSGHRIKDRWPILPVPRCPLFSGPAARDEAPERNK